MFDLRLIINIVHFVQLGTFEIFISPFLNIRTKIYVFKKINNIYGQASVINF